MRMCLRTDICHALRAHGTLELDLIASQRCIPSAFVATPEVSQEPDVDVLNQDQLRHQQSRTSLPLKH